MKKLSLLVGVMLLSSFLPYSYAQSNDNLVILHTNSGKMVIEFFYDDAPNHVDNFIKLAGEGFYDKTVFHRIIKDFMIQGGDPLAKLDSATPSTNWGTGDPGYTIDEEFNTIMHNRGIVSMARSADPNSAGSQFFVVHSDSNFLDGLYTAFGRLATDESFETLDKIANLETPSSAGQAAQGAIGSTIAVNLSAAEIDKVEVVSRDSVADLREWVEPMRTSSLQEPIPGGPYVDEERNISFDAPEGWTIQEPEKTHPTIPDFILVGPVVNGYNPVISFSIEARNGTSLDDKLAAVEELLQEAISSGQLEFTSETKTRINNFDASIKNANGIFTINGVPTDVLFREVILTGPENFYTMTYTTEASIFEENTDVFTNMVESFSVMTESESEPVKNTAQPDNGGGCLIATAAYGSELAPQVQFLREIRDTTLMSTESGASFMATFNSIYYSFSPAIADMERENPLFKEAVKLFITPMLATLSVMTLAEEGSEFSILALGISVIALNLGMYVAAPAFVINRLRQ